MPSILEGFHISKEYAEKESTRQLVCVAVAVLLFPLAL